MRLRHFLCFYFGKMLKILEKLPFFRADMAGLGIYHTVGYGRIGVYRVKDCMPCNEFPKVDNTEFEYFS